jgi:exodeoxyribonuclease VII small subunit
MPPSRLGTLRGMSNSESSGAPADTNAVAGFERSLDELEGLVQRLEKGDLSLDESLKAYERGVALFRSCQTALEQAELRVRLLSDPEDPSSAKPFAPDVP